MDNKCARLDICKDATFKGISCIHYNNNGGDPCEHEASYWDDIKSWLGGIDEKHRFPLYKPGDKLYSIGRLDRLDFVESLINLGRFEFEKITIVGKAESGREGWYYECEHDEYYNQISMFKTKEEGRSFIINYIQNSINYKIDTIEKLKKMNLSDEIIPYSELTYRQATTLDRLRKKYPELTIDVGIGNRLIVNNQMITGVLNKKEERWDGNTMEKSFKLDYDGICEQIELQILK